MDYELRQVMDVKEGYVFSREGRREGYSGGNSEGVTPVPISNTEVKSLSADGTAWETMWESRTSPDTTGTKAQQGSCWAFCV